MDELLLAAADEKASSAVNDHFSEIAANCFQFKEKNFLCDTLLLVGAKKFRAHSIILAAASNFFHEIFKNYTEPELHCIRLPDIDPDIIEVILTYIYTGSLTLPSSYKDRITEVLEVMQQFGFDIQKFNGSVVNFEKDPDEAKNDNTENVIEIAIESDAAEINDGENGEEGEDSDVVNIKKECTGIVYAVADEGSQVLEQAFIRQNGKIEDEGLIIDSKDYQIDQREVENDEKPFCCEHCQKTFKKFTNLERHMKLHTDPNQHLCELCGVNFLSKQELQQHITSAHRMDMLKAHQHLCMDCGKTFAKESTLANHTNRVHIQGEEDLDTTVDKQPFICTHCDKRYASRTSLKLHNTMLHMEKKPYQCSHCSKGFAFKSQLISHIRLHTGDKPYACLTCGKKFGAMLNLVQHNRIHTGEKPFECSYCGNKFAQRSHLQTHIRTHTGEKPYECAQCHKSYKNRLDLRIHSSRIHNLDIKLRQGTISKPTAATM